MGEKKEKSLAFYYSCNSIFYFIGIFILFHYSYHGLTGYNEIERVSHMTLSNDDSFLVYSIENNLKKSLNLMKLNHDGSV